MVTHANSYNAASGADQLPLIERADEFNSDGFKKSIDERAFSDFNIDGSEKDWRQDANEAANNSNFNEKKKQNDKLEDLRDAVEVADEMQEARQEQMIKMGNFEVSKEDLSKINKKYKDQVEGKSDDELQAEADKEGISVQWLTTRAEMADFVEQNGYDRAALEAKFGAENADQYEANVEDDFQQKLDVRKTSKQDFKEENPDTKSSANLTNKEQTAEAQIEDAMSDDLGFDDLEDNSTSLAKSVSQEETTTANLQSDFSQAVEITVADANIPAQDITPERQNINIMDNAIG